MVKLTILAAPLIAVLALAEASTYTTITTTTFEEENPRETGRCHEQIQREQLHHCQMYMSQRTYELALRSFLNPQGQHHLRQCCSQLQNIDQECRCEAIRQIMRQQQQKGGRWQGEKMQEMMKKAMYLPRRCNMEPYECQIHAVVF